MTSGTTETFQVSIGDGVWHGRGDWPHTAYPFSITRTDRIEPYTGTFSQGSAHTTPPTEDDVLASVAFDARCVDPDYIGAYADDLEGVQLMIDELGSRGSVKDDVECFRSCAAALEFLGNEAEALYRWADERDGA